MAGVQGEAVPVIATQSVATTPEAADERVPVPPQVVAPAVHDFRGAGFAPKGYREKAVKSGSSKRKLDEYQEQVNFQLSGSHCNCVIRPMTRSAAFDGQ